MITEKQKVLTDAPEALNKPDQPWEVTVEGDAIVARWKWMDATFFSLTEATNEVREYTFKVTLDDNGKYYEIDRIEQESMGAGLGGGGKIGFGGSSGTFVGKTSRKSMQFGLGKDNQTGKIGLVGFKFDTSAVKTPIRAYLESCGWKKDSLSLSKAGFSVMDNKKARIIIRLVYSICLLVACLATVGFLRDMQFAQGDLQRWLDATARVTESKVTDENLVLRSEKKGNQTHYYKEYTVKYAYNGEFTAWGKVFGFEYKDENRGRVDRYAEEIPARAYVFPKQGDTVAVIYDPEADGSYRIGSKEEWQNRGEVSFANLALPLIFFTLAVLFIFFDMKSIKKRRLAAVKP
jgi:hypothetical protein